MRDEPLRLSAIALLAYLSPPPGDLATLTQQDRSLAIRQAAIASLSRLQGPAGRRCLERPTQPSRSPAARRTVRLGRRRPRPPRRTMLLLDRVESGDLKPTQIETCMRNRLLASSRAEVKARA